MTIFLLVSMVWFFGVQELWHTVTDLPVQWPWLVAAMLYTAIVNDVFGHMILTHRLFPVDPTRIGYKIMAFLFVTDHGWGPVSSFCLVHHRHHECSDQGDKDVANWRIHWYNMDIMSPINYIYQAKTDFGDSERYFARQEKKFQALLDDTWTWLLEEYSHVWAIVFWSMLYVTVPVVLFKVIFMGRVLLGMCTVFSSVCGHTKIPGGYRNFNTPDTSHNNLLLHWLCLCSFPTVLQNNHHGKIYSLQDGVAVHWWEFDLSKYYVRILKHFLQQKSISQ